MTYPSLYWKAPEYTQGKPKLNKARMHIYVKILKGNDFQVAVSKEKKKGLSSLCSERYSQPVISLFTLRRRKKIEEEK